MARDVSSSQFRVFHSIPLWLASGILPTMAVVLVWSVFPHLLLAHQGQLAAGTIGGLALLVLRIAPSHQARASAGKTPMSIVMVSSIGLLLLAISLRHPSMWSGLGVVTMISGVAAWLWYPPASFAPFRSAAHAAIAAAIAICLPAYLEAFGLFPWRETDLGSFTNIAGTFAHPKIFTSSLFSSALGVWVASWPHAQLSRRTRNVARVTLCGVGLTALLFAVPIPFWARVGLGASALIGVLYRRFSKRIVEPSNVAPSAWRWLSAGSWIALLLVFSLPPIVATTTDAPMDDTAFAALDTHAAIASETYVPVIPDTQRLPSSTSNTIAYAEWKAALASLPFGKGAGTHLDETIGHLSPTSVSLKPIPLSVLFGWQGPPHSMLAAMIIEHGIIALFIWGLMAAGGLLLAFLVIRNSNFPSWVATMVGASPAITIAFLRGGSQVVPMFTLLLGWFLLCAPLASAEERTAQRLIPTPSSTDDPRKAPRGRVLILLIPALIASWFVIAETRASAHALRAYHALQTENTATALAHFHEANALFRTPETLYNEAVLLQLRHGSRAAGHVSSLLDSAIDARPHAAFMLTTRAQWHIDQASQHTGNDARAHLRAAKADCSSAMLAMPLWSLPRELQERASTALEQLDATTPSSGPRRIRKRP